MSLGSRFCLKNLGNLFDQGTFIWKPGTFIWDEGSFIWQGGTFIWQEGTFILRRVTISLQIIWGTKFWSCVRTLNNAGNFDDYDVNNEYSDLRISPTFLTACQWRPFLQFCVKMYLHREKYNDATCTKIWHLLKTLIFKAFPWWLFLYIHLLSPATTRLIGPKKMDKPGKPAVMAFAKKNKKSTPRLAQWVLCRTLDDLRMIAH